MTAIFGEGFGERWKGGPGATAMQVLLKYFPSTSSSSPLLPASKIRRLESDAGSAFTILRIFTNYPKSQILLINKGNVIRLNAVAKRPKDQKTKRPSRSNFVRRFAPWPKFVPDKEAANGFRFLRRQPRRYGPGPRLGCSFRFPKAFRSRWGLFFNP